MIAIQIPTYQEALKQAVSDIRFVEAADNVFGTMLSTYHPAMLLQLIHKRDELPRPVKTDIELFTDYFINFYYTPMIGATVRKLMLQ